MLSKHCQQEVSISDIPSTGYGLPAPPWPSPGPPRAASSRPERTRASKQPPLGEKAPREGKITPIPRRGRMRPRTPAGILPGGSSLGICPGRSPSQRRPAGRSHRGPPKTAPGWCSAQKGKRSRGWVQTAPQRCMPSLERRPDMGLGHTRPTPGRRQARPGAVTGDGWKVPSPSG